MALATDEYICIGRIGKPRGVRGEFWVALMTDFPDRFDGLEEVFVEKHGERTVRRIEHAVFQNGRVILKLKDTGSREEAAALRGAYLQVPRTDALPLEDDTFYIFDLLGCTVSDAVHGELGRVEEVMTETAHDILVVRNGAGREVMVPMVASMVRKVDIAARRIDVALPGGLVE